MMNRNKQLLDLSTCLEQDKQQQQQNAVLRHLSALATVNSTNSNIPAILRGRTGALTTDAAAASALLNVVSHQQDIRNQEQMHHHKMSALQNAEDAIILSELHCLRAAVLAVGRQTQAVPPIAPTPSAVAASTLASALSLNQQAQLLRATTTAATTDTTVATTNPSSMIQQQTAAVSSNLIGGLFNGLYPAAADSSGNSSSSISRKRSLPSENLLEGWKVLLDKQKLFHYKDSTTAIGTRELLTSAVMRGITLPTTSKRLSNDNNTTEHKREEEQQRKKLLIRQSLPSGSLQQGNLPHSKRARLIEKTSLSCFEKNWDNIKTKELQKEIFVRRLYEKSIKVKKTKSDLWKIKTDKR